ncbi:hypothetical protein K2173_017651 [Erythroxylum novogranatense]|uniref:F-box protein n=1 Tax=Erythroxylum novogranatense TaxID=1862640 RepID=A0AAV8SM72_9ROSI|nr:hypothetical protein K2173_017651 [Erythroxylum novogranatense]
MWFYDMWILQGNVVLCHVDTAQAYVWRLKKFVLGEHILRPCPENPTPVKVCTISTCGNFAILGTASGWVERFNLQSGFIRGRYLDMSERSSCALNGEGVGVACDATNTLIISAGYHGDVKPGEPVHDEKVNKAEEAENNKKKVDALTAQFLQFLQSSAETNNLPTMTMWNKLKLIHRNIQAHERAQGSMTVSKRLVDTSLGASRQKDQRNIK